MSYWIWWGFIIRDLLIRHGALGAKYKRPLIMNMGCRLTWMILLVGWFDRCVALYTVLPLLLYILYSERLALQDHGQRSVPVDGVDHRHNHGPLNFENVAVDLHIASVGVPNGVREELCLLWWRWRPQLRRQVFSLRELSFSRLPRFRPHP